MAVNRAQTSCVLFCTAGIQVHTFDENLCVKKLVKKILQSFIELLKFSSKGIVDIVVAIRRFQRSLLLNLAIGNRQMH